MTAVLTRELVESAFDAHERGEAVAWDLFECGDVLAVECDDDTPCVGTLRVGIPGELEPVMPLGDEPVIAPVALAPRVSFWRWLIGGAR